MDLRIPSSAISMQTYPEAGTDFLAPSEPRSPQCLSLRVCVLPSRPGLFGLPDITLEQITLPFPGDSGPSTKVLQEAGSHSGQQVSQGSLFHLSTMGFTERPTEIHI